MSSKFSPGDVVAYRYIDNPIGCVKTIEGEYCEFHSEHAGIKQWVHSSSLKNISARAKKAWSHLPVFNKAPLLA